MLTDKEIPVAMNTAEIPDLSEINRKLSDFLGEERDWSNHACDLYRALSQKGFSIDTEATVNTGCNDSVVRVTAYGFQISAKAETPGMALAKAMLKAIQFNGEVTGGVISIPKTRLTFSAALYWAMRGLVICRLSNWDAQIKLELGCTAAGGKIASYLPGEFFKVVDDQEMAIMPRLVATDCKKKIKYDWIPNSVDLMANDWEAL